jgi:hypothetical protein
MMNKLKYSFITTLCSIVIISGFSSLLYAQTDPIPMRKGDKWTFVGLTATFNNVQAFKPILQKAIAKIPVKDAKGKPVLENGKPKQIDSVYYKEIELLAAVQQGEKWGFINKTGKVVVAAKYDFVYDFSEGMAVVGITGEELPQYGYVDYTGKEIIAPKYNGANSFKEGLAAISVIDTATYLARTGFIDKTGKEIIPLKFASVHDFSDGMAAVSPDGKKWGFINSKGQMTVIPQFDNVYDFSEGLAKVYKSLKWGFVDKTGNTIIQYQYQDPGESNSHFQNGLARVRLNNLEGWIDKKNVRKIPIKFTQSKDFSERLAAVQLAGKWGYIDQTGLTVIPAKFALAEDFKDGLAPVNEAGKWGFIDRKGVYVIQPKYSSVEKGFERGIALVEKDGKTFYIDKKGKEYVQ